MKQSEIVKEYIRIHGTFCPAKMANKFWGNYHFGSSVGRVCRKMRSGLFLKSNRDDDGYETFYFADKDDYKVIKSWKEITKEDGTKAMRPIVGLSYNNK